MVSDFKKADFFNFKFLLVILCSIVLFFAPFKNGLFFSKDIYVVELILSLLFIALAIYKFIKKDPFVLNTRTLFAVLLLAAAYIIPLATFQAVNKYGAFDYILRYLTCFLVFLFFSDISSKKNNTFILMNIISLSGVLSSLLVLDTAFGNNINTLLSLSGTGSDGYRIFGIMQYSNTTAAFLGLTFFMLISLCFFTNNKILKAVYSSFCIPLILAIALTMSRGAVLVFAPVYAVIFIFLNGKEKRVKFVLSSIIPIIIAMLTIFPTFKYMNQISEAVSSSADYSGLRATGFLIVFGAIAACLVLSFLLNNLENALNKISDKKYKIIFITLIGIAVISAAIFISTGLYKKVLPQTLIERFTLTGSVSEKTSGRTDIYLDAIDAIRPHMILGAGGNAWNSVYRMYQKTLYDSSEPHNFLLQIWLDSGIIGLIVLVFLCFSILYTLLKNRKTENGFIITLLTGCALMLLGHAFIDFDFSYMYMLLIFFTILGMISGMAGNECEFNSKFNFKKAAVPIGIIFSLLISYNTANALLARKAAASANEKFRQGVASNDVDTLLAALNEMKDAADSDKWNTSYRIMEKVTDTDIQISLNDMYRTAEQILASYNSDEAKELTQKIYSLHLNIVEEALSLDKYNPIINANAASFYISVGETEKGFELIENSVKYNLMGSGRYEDLANAYMVVAKNYLENNKKDEAKPLLERIVKIETDVEELNSTYAKQKLELNTNTISLINEAKELLEK